MSYKNYENKELVSHLHIHEKRTKELNYELDLVEKEILKLKSEMVIRLNKFEILENSDYQVIKISRKGRSYLDQAAVKDHLIKTKVDIELFMKVGKSSESIKLKKLEKKE